MGCAGCGRSINKPSMKRRRRENRHKRWVEGAVGLTKAALQMDKPVATVIVERRAVCHQCSHLKSGRCDICKCFILAKARLAGENCPLDKW